MPDELLPPSSASLAPTSAVPQFEVAEYAGTPGQEHCAMCRQPITGEYFRANGLMVCRSCAAQVQDGRPRDSHSAFTRGVLLGAGAAVLGMIVYATVVIVTGWSIGYLALGVGWFVAKAIKKGSHGLGGRRYQIAAVLLTYAAISMSAIPVGIAYMVKHKGEASTTVANSKDQTAVAAQKTDPEPEQTGMGRAILALLYAGLASPFLALESPGSGAIGLFILFIGLRIAWQMTATAPLALDGPYATGATA